MFSLLLCGSDPIHSIMLKTTDLSCGGLSSLACSDGIALDSMLTCAVGKVPNVKQNIETAVVLPHALLHYVAMHILSDLHSFLTIIVLCCPSFIIDRLTAI